MKIGPIDFNRKDKQSLTTPKEESLNCVFFNEVDNIEQNTDQVVIKKKDKNIIPESKYNSGNFSGFKNVKNLDRTISTTRNGTIIEITDGYLKNESIPNDDHFQFIARKNFRNSNEITITLKNGKQEKTIQLQFSAGEDLLDLRRQKVNFLKFLTEIPAEDFKALWNSNYIEVVTPNLASIQLSGFYCLDDESNENVSIKKYNDNEGIIIESYEENVNSITFFTSSIIPPKRDPKSLYKNVSLPPRDDGYKISIISESSTISKINITSPENITTTIDLVFKKSISDLKHYKHDLPKIGQIIDSLPTSTLHDLCNEIEKICIGTGSTFNNKGRHYISTNEIAINLDTETSLERLRETLVHELGHAIDHVKINECFSETEEYNIKFEELRDILKPNFSILQTPSLHNSNEFFADIYTMLNIENGERLKWITSLLNEYRNSNEPEKLRAIELFDSLVEDTKNEIGERNQLDKETRQNNKFKEFLMPLITNEMLDDINTLCLNKIIHLEYAMGDDKLEIIEDISLNDNDFNKTKISMTTFAEKLLSNENITEKELNLANTIKRYLSKIEELRNLAKEKFEF